MYSRVVERLVSNARFVVPISLALLAIFLTGYILVAAPLNNNVWLVASDVQNQDSTPYTPRILNGKLASLGWIVGHDCQRGMRAYMQTADTNPDAALVGSGWVDPTTGQLINGQSNNCVPGSLAMDNVVQLVHSKGGMAYLTITMVRTQRWAVLLDGIVHLGLNRSRIQLKHY